MTKSANKQKRVIVGQILKGKDGKSDYIKVDSDVVLKKGEFLELENATTIRKRADELVANGKIDEQFAEKLRESADKIPSFVRFRIIKKEQA
jgi:hypothetical protein